MNKITREQLENLDFLDLYEIIKESPHFRGTLDRAINYYRVQNNGSKKRDQERVFSSNVQNGIRDMDRQL